MTVSRRRLFQSLAITAACRTAVQGAEPGIGLEVLRDVSVIHGSNLTDDRLRVVRPVLEQQLPQVRALRDFEVGDMVAPTAGILE